VNTKDNIEQLKSRLKEIANIGHASSLLSWDREVNMPDNGAEHRAEAASELSGLIHQKTLALDEDGLLSGLNQARENGQLNSDEAVIVREVWRRYEREAKLPEEFVRNLSQLTSEAQSVWRKARENDSFSQFGPTLENIVSMQQKKADFLGFEETPYDPLLDGFEPEMTTEKTEAVFADLRDFLVPLIDKIENRELEIDNNIDGQAIEVQQQKKFNKSVAKALGYNFDAGRLDTSTHPFTMGLSPQDVRITTRYHASNLLSSLTGMIHEAGHGLYELGLPNEHYGTPLAKHVSLGIHESQSRFWENHIGRSQAFAQWLTKKMHSHFGQLSDISAENLHRELNTVEPSLIRVEADEVTYNLHVIIRFEIEKKLIEGDLSVDELPVVWNEKYEEYLNVDVPNDAKGVLQDIHWSMGSFGYFPTYTFGTLYAAQLDRAIREDINDIDAKIANGEFEPALNWLRENVHRHGKRYKAEGLMERVTGNKLSADAFQTYITDKYSSLYDIKTKGVQE
jgi:carboxypeptidase Taq